MRKEAFSEARQALVSRAKRAGENAAAYTALAVAIPFLMKGTKLHKTVVEFPPGTDIGFDPNHTNKDVTYDQEKGVLQVPDAGTAIGKIGSTELVVEDFKDSSHRKSRARGRFRWGTGLKPKGPSLYFDSLMGARSVSENVQPEIIPIEGIEARMRHSRGSSTR